MQDITYQVGNSLYINLTNRCTNECVFCIRNLAQRFNKRYALWLENEPSVNEVLAAIGDASRYEQVVFCGYGEPLIRLEAVKSIARALKQKNKKTRLRLDTNGQANLFWGRNVLLELKGLIDKISISLDADKDQKYQEICRPNFGAQAYPAVLEFIKQSKQYIPEVEASIVDLPGINQAACAKIASDLGVTFRVRPYYEETYVS
ncbi:MAG: radical SAM protein [Candidatus Saganbacteria bacterium]|nr:radical SAM protein [Candidatus Saganbacteria bacterium]